MVADRVALTALLDRLADFPLRDRALVRTRDALRAELSAHTDAPQAATVLAFLAALRRYAEGFDHEARLALRDVDRRLGAIYQSQFNLTAERGVITSRLEAIAALRSALSEVAGP